MNAALQEFVENDRGFGQYTERYDEISSDIAVRRQFAAWSAEMDKLEIVKALGIAEGKELGIVEGKELGIAEGKELGKAEGIRDKAIEGAKKLLIKGYPIEDIADSLDLPISMIQEFANKN